MSWGEGFDAMMGNPLFNLGLGILGSNQYGDNWTRAVGEGGLAGIQSHRRNELLGMRKARHQQEMAEAKRRADLHNAQKAAMDAALGNPAMQAAGPPNPDGTMPQVGATGLYATNPQQAQLASALSPDQFAMAMFQQNNQDRAYDRRVLESDRNFDWQQLTGNRNHALAQAGHDLALARHDLDVDQFGFNQMAKLRELEMSEAEAQAKLDTDNFNNLSEAEQKIARARANNQISEAEAVAAIRAEAMKAHRSQFNNTLRALNNGMFGPIHQDVIDTLAGNAQSLMGMSPVEKEAIRQSALPQPELTNEQNRKRLEAMTPEQLRQYLLELSNGMRVD